MAPWHEMLGLGGAAATRSAAAASLQGALHRLQWVPAVVHRLPYSVLPQ